MTMQVKSFFLSAALAAMLLPAAAQSNAPAANTAQTDPPTQQDKATVGERKENQQDRIANGVKSGELTSGEASQLEKKESKLNAETRAMRAADGGKLTAADKAKLQRQQNRLSHQIYNQKHDAQTQPGTNPPTKGAQAPTEVGRREENQQDRIAQGVQSGQLTAGEASKLEKRDARINNEIKTDRAANGGALTPAERAQVNRQQNRVSRHIYRDKHNGRHQ
jgi:predicted transglutaminase-like cysteine proteinase